MKKIMVIGSCGAGKSTLSQKLAEKLGYPIIHLDKLSWQAGWVEREPEEFYELQKEALQQENWVADGNYGGTQKLRMEYADTIVWLDFPMPICLWRALKRIWKYHGTTRPDMTEGCNERFDLEFLHYVITFPWHGRKRIIKMLKFKRPETKLFHFKKDHEVENFLTNQIKTR